MINFLNRRKINSSYKHKNEDRDFLNYNQIKKILVLFNIDDHEDVAHVVNELRKNGKIVAAWTSKPKGSETVINYFPCMVRIIDPKVDMTWMQTISKATMRQFGSLDYETIMDFTSQNDDVLNYLLARNTSRFSIGLRERGDAHPYDLVVMRKEEDSISETFKYLKAYLHKNFE